LSVLLKVTVVAPGCPLRSKLYSGTRYAMKSWFVFLERSFGFLVVRVGK